MEPRVERLNFEDPTDGYFAILELQPGLRTVMPLLRLAARTEANVLVRGETGAGKEILARAIHERSSRRQAPFVVSNCAAIPHDLMESEMFGHVRGAFTGAVRDHVGYFESARGGTLLLDEIGDLHPDLQAKLLRVVEAGSFRRVGSSKELQNHARLIASTNQPLEHLVEARGFRADLYYRLNVLTIHLPSLSQRRDDIPVLVDLFLQRFFHSRKEAPPRLSPEALELLSTHGWPGNVRELRNCMERIALIARGPTIEPADVLRVLPVPEPVVDPERVLPLREVERVAIRAALEHFAGNRTRTAIALRIGRRTLQNKIKEFGLEEVGRPRSRD